MEIKRFIATVEGKKQENNSIKTFVLYSDEKMSNEEIIKEAQDNLSIICHDIRQLNVTKRKELVHIRTDLLPTDNGKIPNPDGESLKAFKKYILENRENLIGNNSIELFYDSKRNKMKIEKFNSELTDVFLDNLSEEYLNWFEK